MYAVMFSTVSHRCSFYSYCSKYVILMSNSMADIEAVSQCINYSLPISNCSGLKNLLSEIKSNCYQASNYQVFASALVKLISYCCRPSFFSIKSSLIWWHFESSKACLFGFVFNLVISPSGGNAPNYCRCDGSATSQTDSGDVKDTYNLPVKSVTATAGEQLGIGHVHCDTQGRNVVYREPSH